MPYPNSLINLEEVKTTNNSHLQMNAYRFYHSLAKERPWVEHLTGLPKMGVGHIPALTMKEHHVCSESMLLNMQWNLQLQCSSFKVES